MQTMMSTARFFTGLVAWLPVAAFGFGEDVTRKPTIRVEVFSDFQCPFCKALAAPLHELSEYKTPEASLEVVFHHFPLEFHVDAEPAHRAAFAAAAQGKFWEMHDLLFANAAKLKREDLMRYAGQLGLDEKRFAADLDSDAARKRVEADRADGMKRGVSGTPTLFINGKMRTGAMTFEQFKASVSAEAGRIGSAREIPQSLLSLGPADAAARVEVFADLQSPVTRSAMAVLDQLAATKPGVRINFRNFPLGFHNDAGLAHDAAMVAAKQGKFWEMVHYLLDHQEGLRPQNIAAHAAALGMNEVEFAAAVDRRAYWPKVEADIQEALDRVFAGVP